LDDSKIFFFIPNYFPSWAAVRPRKKRSIVKTEKITVEASEIPAEVNAETPLGGETIRKPAAKRNRANYKYRPNIFWGPL